MDYSALQPHIQLILKQHFNIVVLTTEQSQAALFPFLLTLNREMRIEREKVHFYMTGLTGTFIHLGGVRSLMAYHKFQIKEKVLILYQQGGKYKMLKHPNFISQNFIFARLQPSNQKTVWVRPLPMDEPFFCVDCSLSCYNRFHFAGLLKRKNLDPGSSYVVQQNIPKLIIPEQIIKAIFEQSNL